MIKKKCVYLDRLCVLLDFNAYVYHNVFSICYGIYFQNSSCYRAQSWIDCTLWEVIYHICPLFFIYLFIFLKYTGRNANICLFENRKGNKTKQKQIMVSIAKFYPVNGWNSHFQLFSNNFIYITHEICC